MNKPKYTPGNTFIKSETIRVRLTCFHGARVSRKKNYLTTYRGQNIFLTSLLFGGSSNADFTRSPFILQNEFSSDSNWKKVIFLSYLSNAAIFIIFFLALREKRQFFQNVTESNHLTLVFSLHTPLEICSKLKNLAKRSNHASFWHCWRLLFIFRTQNTCVGG